MYDHALTSDQVLQNYLANITDLEKQKEVYDFNYNNNTLPKMYLTGDVTNMTDKQSVPMKIEYVSTNEEKFGMSENLSQDAYQFLMGLYMKFQKYSERDDANPKKDRLSLRTCILRLSDNKYDKLMDEIGTVIEKYQMMNEGGKERNLSIISAPIDV